MSKKDTETNPKKAENNAGKKPSGSRSLPVLFDVTFSISKLIVLLLGLSTTIISVISGANAFSAALRGCLAMFAIGLTLWLINWIMVHDSLEGVLIKVKKLKIKNAKDSNGASTFEKNA